MLFLSVSVNHSVAVELRKTTQDTGSLNRSLILYPVHVLLSAAAPFQNQTRLLDIIKMKEGTGR